MWVCQQKWPVLCVRRDQSQQPGASSPLPYWPTKRKASKRYKKLNQSILNWFYWSCKLDIHTCSNLTAKVLSKACKSLLMESQQRKDLEKAFHLRQVTCGNCFLQSRCDKCLQITLCFLKQRKAGFNCTACTMYSIQMIQQYKKYVCAPDWTTCSQSKLFLQITFNNLHNAVYDRLLQHVCNGKRRTAGQPHRYRM